MSEPQLKPAENFPLAAEKEVFEREQERLQRENPCGGFVVIKGGEIYGVWRDEFDALGEGLKKYGDVSFLVRDINDTGEPIFYNTDILEPGYALR